LAAVAKAKATAKAFTALRAASYFLLLVQENVTKEKDTPSRNARMKPARCPALLAGLGPARTRPSMASNMRAFPPSPAPLLGARRTGFQSQEQEQGQPKQGKIKLIA